MSRRDDDYGRQQARIRKYHNRSSKSRETRDRKRRPRNELNEPVENSKHSESRQSPANDQHDGLNDISHIRSAERNGSIDSPIVVATQTGIELMSLLSMIVRLSSHTLCTALSYFHRYQEEISKFESEQNESLESDEFTLAVAALSLASKTTESQRRPRELLVPAYRLIHPDATQFPLAVPSYEYEALRAGMVHYELVLLRALGFSTTIDTVFAHDNLILENALAAGIGALRGSQYFADTIGNSKQYGGSAQLKNADSERETMLACGIVPLVESQIGCVAVKWAVQIYKIPKFISLDSDARFEPWFTTATAVLAVFLSIKEIGFCLAVPSYEWIRLTVKSIDQDCTDLQIDRINSKLHNLILISLVVY
ncbi:uncharacterized protein V1516DRAFT_670858 [Lipomyces oligophaga]|uniref:uncharacterized protein n=1 Tax=Lipomyces oligophaga TaxID=45792 RepID=UPI0034CD9903